MPQEIYIQDSAEYDDDCHLLLSGKVCLVRQLPLASTWNYASIAMEYSFWPDPTTDTTPASIANVELWFGFCKSGANHPGVLPITNMDTMIGWRWGASTGPFGAGETFVGSNYSNGDWYYQPSTGQWLYTVFNGTGTSRASSANGIATKCFRQYNSRRSICALHIEDRGANWFVQPMVQYPGGGGWNAAQTYNMLIKAVKGGYRSAGLGPPWNDWSHTPRMFASATFAQDNTRGRPDSLFVLFRDHNATGAKFVIHGLAANTNGPT